MVGGASAHEEFCDVLSPVILQQLHGAAPSSNKAERRQSCRARARSVVAWASAAGGAAAGKTHESWWQRQQHAKLKGRTMLALVGRLFAHSNGQQALVAVCVMTAPGLLCGRQSSAAG